MYEKQKKYNVALTKRRRAMFIELFGGKCIKCNATDNLHFDHIDPRSKSCEINDLRTCSIATVLAELIKCQLLCKSCHRIKSAEERKTPVPHGTNAGYCRGCRCDACKKSRSEYARRLRNRDQ
jgi:hypothetical protein